MSQTRIVVSSKLKPLAEELVAITGVDSLSDLLSLLLTKYGRHLRASWELPPQQQQAVNPIANPVQVFAPNAEEPRIQEPQYVQEIEIEPEPDPMIERIAKLVDVF
jgi:hypothetical protein